MAKVATRGLALPTSNPIHFSGTGGNGGSTKTATAMKKRKTPSELRDEQLKRKNVVEPVDKSAFPELGSMWTANGITCDPKKPDLPKHPRYIDTRVDELFPSRKISQRFTMLSGKENVKENITTKHTESSKNSVTSKSASESSEDSNGRASQPHNATEKCGVIFRSVTDLSLGGEKSSAFSVDMDKAFKGLAARAPPVASAIPAESSDKNTSPASTNCSSEFHIPSGKIPLDFTLKTSMRVVSSSSMNWFHKLTSCGTISVEQFNPHAGEWKISSSEALHYWVYPQCSLPASVISVLTLPAKGEGPSDFLSKRQLAWEDSFRSLYYLLRMNICKLFYVCTGQFVAMFTCGSGSTESRGLCNAYVSQSTRSLRSLLQEQDICFTMPLCQSKMEQVTKEDLFELSEIEKYNVGKTKRSVSLSDADGTPESLLAFRGNKGVHGLYEFLLNYRSLLPSLTSLDVPLLYSPVPFENAAFSAPEVKCKEVRKIDQLSFPLKEPGTTTSTSYYSIEVKDAYLPPWIICNVCKAIESHVGSFEASFVTEPMSVGLNVGLEGVRQSSEPGEQLHDNTCSVGVQNVVSSDLNHAFLKGLKYSDKSYTASLSRV